MKQLSRKQVSDITAEKLTRFTSWTRNRTALLKLENFIHINILTLIT